MPVNILVLIIHILPRGPLKNNSRLHEICIHKKINLMIIKMADAMQEAPGFPLMHDHRSTAATINKQRTKLKSEF